MATLPSPHVPEKAVTDAFYTIHQDLQFAGVTQKECRQTAETVMRVTYPMVAAQALRDAADALGHSEADESCAAWLRDRATELEDLS